MKFLKLALMVVVISISTSSYASREQYNKSYREHIAELKSKGFSKEEVDLVLTWSEVFESGDLEKHCEKRDTVSNLQYVINVGLYEIATDRLGKKHADKLFREAASIDNKPYKMKYMQEKKQNINLSRSPEEKKQLCKLYGTTNRNYSVDNFGYYLNVLSNAKGSK